VLLCVTALRHTIIPEAALGIGKLIKKASLSFMSYYQYLGRKNELLKRKETWYENKETYKQ
jgi:hypothetical protein